MPKRKCIFNDDLKRTYTTFKKGKNDSEVYCLVCNCFISIANKGKCDIEVHLATRKHQRNANTVPNALDSVREYVALSENTKFVEAAEATLTFHTIIHHQSFNSLDCTVELNRKIYYDSDISEKVSCSGTKSTDIVTNILGPLSTRKLLEDLEEIPYIGIAIDTSNHLAKNMLPIIIQYFDFKQGGIKNKIIDISFENDGSLNTISDIIINSLNKYELSSRCISFYDGNGITNFDRKIKQEYDTIYSRLRLHINNYIIGIGCPVHLLNKTIHRGCDSLSVDIEVFILKLFNYFSVYEVQTIHLKDFIEFVKVEYKNVLCNAKTRWLYLLPVINRLLFVFDVLKSHFLSSTDPPNFLFKFFNNNLSEAYLLLVHSLMTVFYNNIQKMENFDISLIESINIISEIVNLLQERLNNNFMPMKIESILNSLRVSGLGSNVEDFLKEVNVLYKKTINYLESCLEPLKHFRMFSWMCFKDEIKWNEITPSLQYLEGIEISIKDSEFFNQFCALKQFINNLSEEESKENIQKKWTKYFNACSSQEQYSELLKIAQFVFAIPNHNAIVERINDMIDEQWTQETNNLSQETIKDIILTRYNFHDMNCKEFYDWIVNQIY
ncbi:uncharacterized protein [Centruroides vittatus]